MQHNPISQFAIWFREAGEAGIDLPEAMTLATVSGDGLPSARIVLLKNFDERGFTFFTNYGSRKARELAENPHAALVFHWREMQRQVRIEGVVHKISVQESRTYFNTRPVESRIGAWASRQSEELENRSQLEARIARLSEKFAGREVPLPPFWGGFYLAPNRVEFWQGRKNRLHDRFLYYRQEGNWYTKHLFP